MNVPPRAAEFRDFGDYDMTIVVEVAPASPDTTRSNNLTSTRRARLWVTRILDENLEAMGFRTDPSTLYTWHLFPGEVPRGALLTLWIEARRAGENRIDLRSPRISIGNARAGRLESGMRAPDQVALTVDASPDDEDTVEIREIHWVQPTFEPFFGYTPPPRDEGTQPRLVHSSIDAGASFGRRDDNERIYDLGLYRVTLHVAAAEQVRKLTIAARLRATVHRHPDTGDAPWSALETVLQWDEGEFDAADQGLLLVEDGGRVDLWIEAEPYDGGTRVRSALRSVRANVEQPVVQSCSGCPVDQVTVALAPPAGRDLGADRVAVRRVRWRALELPLVNR